MPTATTPRLRPGKVYRTRDFKKYSANAPRLAKRLVEEGRLVALAHGLFASPRKSRFGNVPPEDAALMHKFLGSSRFVFTGSDYWNALGLGTTAVHAKTVVYNAKRTGLFPLGGREFMLRRVQFPKDPPREWFVVDLLEHAEQVAASPADLRQPLTDAVARGEFDRDLLRKMAAKYGTKKTQSLVLDVTGELQPASDATGDAR